MMWWNSFVYIQVMHLDPSNTKALQELTWKSLDSHIICFIMPWLSLYFYDNKRVIAWQFKIFHHLMFMRQVLLKWTGTITLKNRRRCCTKYKGKTKQFWVQSRTVIWESIPDLTIPGSLEHRGRKHIQTCKILLQ